MQISDQPPISINREQNVCSARLIRGITGVVSTDGHQVPNQSTVYGGGAPISQPIVIAPDTILHMRRWERSTTRRSHKPDRAARISADTSTNVSTALTIASSTCTARITGRGPGRATGTETRGQHVVMMTATSTESDANSSSAYEREMPTQQQPQWPTEPLSTNSHPHPHLLHSPLPTMEFTKITATSTGAAVPMQELEQTPEEAGLGPEQEREQETDVTSMIAREGSELARRLRESGWIARAGWRSSDATGRPVWHLRFEQPSTPFNS